MYEANRCKLLQNDDLLEALSATGDSYLVEASPYDTIWGIRLGQDNQRAYDPQQWEGTNWLGLILTKLRENIKFQLNLER